LHGQAQPQVSVDRCVLVEAIPGDGAGVAPQQQANGILGLADVLADIRDRDLHGIEAGLALHDGGTGEDIGVFEGLRRRHILLTIFDGSQGNLQLLIISLQCVVIVGDTGHELGLDVAVICVTLQEGGQFGFFRAPQFAPDVHLPGRRQIGFIGLGGGHARIFLQAATRIADKAGIEGFLALTKVCFGLMDTGYGDAEIEVMVDPFLDEVL